jgi:hypothetical protein
MDTEHMTTPKTTERPDGVVDGRDGSAPVQPGARDPRPLVVFVALLALLVVAFGAAVLLDRRFRPAVGTVPDTAAPAQVTAGAGPSQGAGQASGTRFARTPLEREVEEAFLRYLDVYSNAVINLDSSRLPEVLDGAALQWVQEEVNDLKERQRPAKVIEENRTLRFTDVTPTSATLEDEYVNRSVYVDPRTKEPLPRTSAPTRVRQTYQYRKISGVWKIVDGTRDELGEVAS